CWSTAGRCSWAHSPPASSLSEAGGRAMTPDTAVHIVTNAVYVIILIVCVLIVPSLLGGLLISIFQAATQINEQMLSFLPRLLITLGMLILAGHWILRTLLDLFATAFAQASSLIGCGAHEPAAPASTRRIAAVPAG